MRRAVLLALVILCAAGCEGPGPSGRPRARPGKGSGAGDWTTIRRRGGTASRPQPATPTTRPRAGATEVPVAIDAEPASDKIVMVAGSPRFGEQVAGILPAGAACYLRLTGVDKLVSGVNALGTDASRKVTFPETLSTLLLKKPPSECLSSLAAYLSCVTGGPPEKIAGFLKGVREIHAALYDAHMDRFRSVVVFALATDEQAYGVLVASERTLRKAGRENNIPFYSKQPDRPRDFYGPTIRSGAPVPPSPFPYPGASPGGIAMPPPGAPVSPSTAIGPPGMFSPPPGQFGQPPKPSKALGKYAVRVVTQVGNFVMAGESGAIKAILRVTQNPLTRDARYRNAYERCGDTPVFAFINPRKLNRLLGKLGPHVPGATALAQNVSLLNASGIVVAGAAGKSLSVRALGIGNGLAEHLVPDGAQLDCPLLRLVPRGSPYCVWFRIADFAGGLSELAGLAAESLGGMDAASRLLAALESAGASSSLYPALTGQVVAFLPPGTALGAGDEQGGVIFGLTSGRAETNDISKCLLKLRTEQKIEDRTSRYNKQAITTFLRPLPLSWTIDDGYLALSFAHQTVADVIEAAGSEQGGFRDVLASKSSRHPEGAAFVAAVDPARLVTAAAMVARYAPGVARLVETSGPVVVAGRIENNEIVMECPTPAGLLALITGGPPGVAGAMVSPVGCEAHLQRLRAALAMAAKRNRGVYPAALEFLIGDAA